MMAAQLKWYIFLVLLVMFSVALMRYVPAPEITSPVLEGKRSIDYFSLGYSKLQMDELGVPHDKLVAEYAVHYSDSDETELTKPVMVVYKETLPPWYIRSDTGLISSGGAQLFLNGQVDIDRAAAEGVRAIDIKTTNLRVQPKQNYAETDDWAEMISELDIISGIGMKLFYQEPLYIELLANVKGRHEYK